MMAFRGMRLVFAAAGLAVASVFAGGVLAAPAYPVYPVYAAAGPEEDAVLATVQALFDGMSKRDAAAIKEQALPGGTMVLMRNGNPTQMTIEAFADRAGRPGTTHTQERIHDPVVRVDNDLAVVWAPFEYLIEGKVDHCGTDLFNLVKKDGKWLIASVADTGRKDCGGK